MGPPHSSPMDERIQLGRGPHHRVVPGKWLMRGQKLEAVSFACTVRNHWDLMLSARFGNHVFAGGDKLFPFADAGFPQMTVLRYETLRDDLSAWLESVGLDPLADDEMQHTAYRTKGRPTGPYAPHYTPLERDAVEEQFADEIARLGYVFA